jgi:RNA polymerase sigma factor (sigma-70 family)
MPTSPLSVVLQHLLADLRPEEDGMADGELLTRFLRSRDGDALAALVRRHAPMVWGVCRRLLNHQDAEDAFQATFLVLVRKAADVPRQAVANWLYGVARQTAVRLRAAAAKRARRETQVVNMPEPTAAEVREADVQTLVDDELNRLPDHYRGVVVLCDLEGMTRREAARHLGIPEGSVASRLARARVMLAKRLTQRGVVFSGGSVAAALSTGSASASAPSALVASTINAASLLAAGRAAGIVSAKVAALTEETVKAMFVNKLKAVLAVVLVVGLALGGIGLGIGLPTHRVAMAQAETPKEAPVKKESPTAPVATGKDADKGREGIQVETKDKPLVVHAVLESVDAQRAVIAAKWVTGNDVNDAFRLLVTVP